MTRNDPKLDDLKARIDRARGEPLQDAKREEALAPKGIGTALRLSSELLAGVVVGGGLGYFFDKGLGTSPFGLIVFILIGFAAGTTNLIRAASQSNSK